jgi:hypothetical protein
MEMGGVPVSPCAAVVVIVRVVYTPEVRPEDATEAIGTLIDVLVFRTESIPFEINPKTPERGTEAFTERTVAVQVSKVGSES